MVPLVHWVLVCDWDGKRSERFRSIMAGRVVLTPFQAPNANAHTERLVRSIRAECLDRLILFGRRWLLPVLDEFGQHYQRSGTTNSPW